MVNVTFYGSPSVNKMRVDLAREQYDKQFVLRTIQRAKQHAVANGYKKIHVGYTDSNGARRSKYYNIPVATQGA